MRPLLALVSLAIVASAGEVRAQSAPTYVVVAGDTCPIVAKKVYGDAERIDVLHEANPQLGAVPHNLVPGQVLNTPKPAPPAKVTFVRKDVVAATPATHPAKVNEDLERGHKVSTLANSSAELTFKDTTRLQLADHTLVVVLGTSSSQASAKQATPADTTLMTGELRVHLGALVGKPKAIDTPSAKTDVSGESKLSVDDKSATRLAVYAGKSSIAAGGAKVNVDKGFGSKAELGKKPTKPLPLPAAPVWSTPIPTGILALGDAEIASAYRPGEGGPTVAKYHVQLSRDAAFNDLIVDVRVASDVTRFEAKALGPGRYFARVSAIDADVFEGPYGDVARFVVIRMSASPASAGKTAAITVDGGALGNVACGLDGAPMTPVTASIPFTPGHPHVLRCAPTSAPSELAELSFDESRGGPIAFHDERGEVHVASAMIEEEVKLTIRDASGAPVRNARIVAKAPAGVSVAPIRELAPGVYVTVVRRPAAITGVVVFELGAMFAHSVKLSAMNADGQPVSSQPSASSHELGIFIGAYDARGTRNVGGALGLDAMAHRPLLGGVFGIGLRGSFERYGFGGETTRSGNAYALALPLTFGPAWRHRPFLAVSPMFVLGRLRDDADRLIQRAPGFGAQLGVGFRLGSERAHAVQLETGYRLLREVETDVSLSGFYVTLSGRLGL